MVGKCLKPYPILFEMKATLYDIVLGGLHDGLQSLLWNAEELRKEFLFEVFVALVG